MTPTTISHAIRFKRSCYEGAGQRVHERLARRDGLRVVRARAVKTVRAIKRHRESAGTGSLQAIGPVSGRFAWVMPG